MSDDSEPTDIAVPLPTPEGEPQRVMRVRGGPGEDGPTKVQLGAVLPVEHGVPLPPGADLVEFKDRKDGAYDCVTVYESPHKPAGGGWKPMSVSKETFATNWNRTFGSDTDDEPLLN